MAVVLFDIDLSTVFFPSIGHPWICSCESLFSYSVLVESSSCIRYVFEMAAVWAACSLYQHTSIWIESSFASPVGKETAAISTKQRLTILRYHRQSTDTPPTIDRYTSDISAEMSTDIPTDSVDRRSINSNNMSTDTRPTCRSTYRSRVSTDTRSTDALSTHDPN